MLVSYVVIGAYIYATYKPKTILLLKVNSGHWYPIFSLTCHVFFLLEYILQLYVQKNFHNYILSRDSVVNFLTTVPYLIVVPLLEDFVSAALFVKMLDLIRFMTLARIIDYNNEGSQNIMKSVSLIILRVICLVLVMSGIVRLWETIDKPEVVNEDFKFDRVIFFVMTTVSTIGYRSDIVSTTGRITTILLLAFVVYFIPNQSSKMMQLLGTRSLKSIGYYKNSDKIPFVLLIGSVYPTALFNFLNEYFHDDHGDEQRHCVIMVDKRLDQLTEQELR